MHYFGKTFIDEQAFFVQTSKLKKALPDDLKKAERVTRDSDRVVSAAQNEAQRMMGEAQNEAQRMVAEAKAEAQRMVGDARAQADRTIQDARSHSDRIIEDARREAERIVADSQQHAEQLVAEHVITQRAGQMAEESHRTAVREATEMRAQADSYALEMLDKAGIVLQRLAAAVEQSKEQVQQSRQ